MRWVALHLIEELTRHAGHADIIRESIDGATMYELMAGLEGWPETDWIKPWKPATVAGGTQVHANPERDGGCGDVELFYEDLGDPATRRCC